MEITPGFITYFEYLYKTISGLENMCTCADLATTGDHTRLEHYIEKFEDFAKQAVLFVKSVIGEQATKNLHRFLSYNTVRVNCEFIGLSEDLFGHHYTIRTVMEEEVLWGQFTNSVKDDVFMHKLQLVVIILNTEVFAELDLQRYI